MKMSWPICILLSYCITCWVIAPCSFIADRKKYQEKFGVLFIPTAVITTITSPVWTLIELVKEVVRLLAFLKEEKKKQ